MEGWRDGGMEGWRDGGMEGWRDGGMEGWRDGGMEGSNLALSTGSSQFLAKARFRAIRSFKPFFTACKMPLASLPSPMSIARCSLLRLFFTSIARSCRSSSSFKSSPSIMDRSNGLLADSFVTVMISSMISSLV